MTSPTGHGVYSRLMWNSSYPNSCVSFPKLKCLDVWKQFGNKLTFSVTAFVNFSSECCTLALRMLVSLEESTLMNETKKYFMLDALSSVNLWSVPLVAYFQPQVRAAQDWSFDWHWYGNSRTTNFCVRSRSVHMFVRQTNKCCFGLHYWWLYITYKYNKAVYFNFSAW